MKKANQVTQANQVTFNDLQKQNKEIKQMTKRVETNLRKLNNSFAFIQYNQIINEIIAPYSKFKFKNTSHICNTYSIVILNDINEMIENAILNNKIDQRFKESFASNINNLKKVLYVRNNSSHTSSITIEQQLLEMIKTKIIEYEKEIERLEGYLKEEKTPLVSQDIENFKIKEQIEHMKQKIESIKQPIS